ncbi:Tetraacyldisaccharide 4'-kinase (Lipid A 4'-kinase) [Magnetospirillum gryphiswaldense MSR-1 v2]|uniref:Tetraacyldisaccharide 4'-kinase n=1 Tax=Magnetospirillum gryphiswaldense (strain DSM 6361 / JCM 21280 / NBRC 15271 / MSR-1) TaxID=431944 RepID=V6EYP4_MAGGM|nr:tetraacyldisaccharide 4'-kinase [Magnetospirillum gryphiswaldense]CDK97343.1 Tetraacyldisaccharide 4'-kinase (Lipid A 4'-kinase) [Magnetospirillum gryphiswaldense MSR-1 v2]
MRAPDFWRHDGLWPRLLAPLGGLYARAGRRRRLGGEGFAAAMPVICVGNIVAGGAGKTPVCLAVARHLQERGRQPHFLTRGYGGTEAGPRLVDPLRHPASRVGDEALLLAAQAPTWVARHRPDGATAAAEMGAQVLIMDDGFQNGSLRQDLALVVVDGGYGFGNGRVIPAGPCRESVEEGMARATAMVLIGDDLTGAATMAGGKTVLRARLCPGPEAADLAGARVVAFAGIGRPEKFFATLRQAGADVVATHAFADHHPYGRADVERLRQHAASLNAQLWTTAKDAVRLPAWVRADVRVLTVTLAWDDSAAINALLAGIVWP